MNAASLSVQKARALVASLRDHRTGSPTWDARVDRDLVRVSHELAYRAQSSSPQIR